MATKKASKVMTAAQRARTAMSREARTAYGEIEQGVKHLEQSIGEIERGLRKTEKKIEAEAQAQIRELRKEARTRLKALESKQREAARALKSLSTAAGDSWREINQSATALLADARATAVSVVERFRSALGG